MAQSKGEDGYRKSIFSILGDDVKVCRYMTIPHFSQSYDDNTDVCIILLLIAEGGVGFGTEPSDVAGLQAVGDPIDFLPPTKIHQAAASAHCFCFSIGSGSWHQHIQDGRSNNLRCRVQILCAARREVGGS